jgi:hypothetical protein
MQGAFMKPGKIRKTSPKLEKSANPGPGKNARSYRVGNPSGLPNLDMPKGRGDTENDNAATEKQNQ